MVDIQTLGDILIGTSIVAGSALTFVGSWYAITMSRLNKERQESTRRFSQYVNQLDRTAESKTLQLEHELECAEPISKNNSDDFLAIYSSRKKKGHNLFEFNNLDYYEKPSKRLVLY